MIMLQVVWCCKMNRGGLITAGVFGLISALGALIAGILLIGYYESTMAILAFLSCGLWIATSTLVFVFVNKDFHKFQGRSNSTSSDNNGATVVAVPIASSEMNAPAQHKYAEAKVQKKEEDFTSSSSSGAAAEGLPSPQKETPADTATPTVEIETTVKPDGSITRKTTKKTKNLDGSMTVEVTVEEGVSLPEDEV